MPTITVRDAAAGPPATPVDNAVVCIETPNGEVIACGVTHNSGIFDVANFDETVEGEFKIRASKKGYYSGLLSIDAVSFNLGAIHYVDMTSLLSEIDGADAQLLQISFLYHAFLAEFALYPPTEISLFLLINDGDRVESVLLSETTPRVDKFFEPGALLTVMATDRFWRKSVRVHQAIDGLNFLSIKKLQNEHLW